MAARPGSALTAILAILIAMTAPSLALAQTGGGETAEARRLESALQAVSARIAAVTVRIDTEDGLGSGTLIDASGLVLTSAHVVEGCRRIRVVLADGRQSRARILGVNGRGDLALLRLEDRPGRLAVAEVGDSEAIAAGAWVVAAGHPYAAYADAAPTLSLGRIRDLDGAVRAGADKVFRRALVSDAPLSPGSSGGGLFDLEGRLVGVNAAVTASGGSAFTVRIAEFLRDAERLRKGEFFDRVSDDFAERNDDASDGRGVWFDRQFAAGETELRRRVVEIPVGRERVAGLVVSPDGDVVSPDAPFADMPIGIVLAAHAADGAVRSVRLVGRDAAGRVALLRMATSERLPCFDLDDMPAAERGTLVATVTRGGIAGGIVSAGPRRPPVEMTGADGRPWPAVLQADVRLAPDGAGRPLIDLDGRLVGLVLQPRLTARAEETTAYGALVLPTADLAASLGRLRAAADVAEPRLPYLGIGFASDPDGRSGGALIALVEDARPAARAGLARGDRLVSIGGRRVADAAEAGRMIRALALDRPATLVVERDGRLLERVVPVQPRDLADR